MSLSNTSSVTVATAATTALETCVGGIGGDVVTEFVTLTDHQSVVQWWQEQYQTLQKQSAAQIQLLEQALEKARSKLEHYQEKLQSLSSSSSSFKKRKRKDLDDAPRPVGRPRKVNQDDEINYDNANINKNNKNNRKWMERYNQLRAFKEHYGHVQVSRHVSTATATMNTPELKQLGNWISVQRQQYKNLITGRQPSNLTPARVRALMELGFSWHASRSGSNAAGNAAAAAGGTVVVVGRQITWEERYRQLQDFVERHGHARVPQKYKSNPPGLGGWVLEQRRAYKNNYHHQQQKHKNSTCWQEDEDEENEDDEERNDDGDEEEEDDKNDTKKDGDPHKNNITTTTTTTGKTQPSKKRQRRRLGGTGLTPERMAQLEALGFEWSLRNRSCQKQSPLPKQQEPPPPQYDDPTSVYDPAPMYDLHPSLQHPHHHHRTTTVHPHASTTTTTTNVPTTTTTWMHANIFRIN